MMVVKCGVCSHNIARMAYEVILAPQAAASLAALPAYHRTQVRDALERHLRHEPNTVVKRRHIRRRAEVEGVADGGSGASFDAVMKIIRS